MMATVVTSLSTRLRHIMCVSENLQRVNRRRHHDTSRESRRVPWCYNKKRYATPALNDWKSKDMNMMRHSMIFSVCVVDPDDVRDSHSQHDS